MDGRRLHVNPLFSSSQAFLSFVSRSPGDRFASERRCKYTVLKGVIPVTSSGAKHRLSCISGLSQPHSYGLLPKPVLRILFPMPAKYPKLVKTRTCWPQRRPERGNSSRSLHRSLLPASLYLVSCKDKTNVCCGRSAECRTACMSVFVGPKTPGWHSLFSADRYRLWVFSIGAAAVCKSL